MAHDVFISHSAQDKPIADAVCNTLESHGIRCWIAPRDIRVGQSWPSAIMDGIIGARVLVVVFSSHSNRSEAVLNEIERAYHNNLIIVPFRIEAAPMGQDMEFFLSRRHWLDALTPPLQQHLERLAEQLGEILPVTDPKPETLPVTAPASPPPVKEPASSPPPLDGSDIRLDLPLTWREAQAGVRKEVPGQTGMTGVSIPPGVADGQDIPLPGQGSPGEYGGQPGDLIVTLKVAPPEPVQGKDARAEVTLTAAEAKRGCRKTVNVGGRPVTVMILPRLKDGDEKTYPNRGLPGQFGGANGALIVRYKVAPPVPKLEPPPPVSPSPVALPPSPSGAHNLVLNKGVWAGIGVIVLVFILSVALHHGSQSSPKPVPSTSGNASSPVSPPHIVRRPITIPVGSMLSPPRVPIVTTKNNPTNTGGGSVPFGPPRVPIVTTKNNPTDGAIMVYVPAGLFQMGDDDQSDNPHHTVTLSSYYIYKNDVTVAMYRRFCTETGRVMPELYAGFSGDDHPIVNVSWYDAKAYCDWAGVHLPTEAQWEKAVRGTDGRKYPWGNEFDGSRLSNSVGSNSAKSTSAVGSFPSGASPYGCLDMAGNVWQWCADWFDENYWKSDHGADPPGPASGEYRVLRGGSWAVANPGYFRASLRLRDAPGKWFLTYGFRGASGG